MKKLFKNTIIIIIFLMFFFSCFYEKNDDNTNNNNIDDVRVFMNNTSNTNKRIGVLRKEIDNSDIVGIISSSAIGLNAVVVQSSDNNYYMNHDINRNYDVKGSIFIDYRNDFSSKKLLIYGHNSQDVETDFGKLERYLDSEFVKKNLYIDLITEKKTTRWEIFSVMVVPNNTTTHTRIEFSSVDQLTDHIEWMIKNSKITLNKEVSINDQLMTLQTCYYEPQDSFLLINLKKVEDNDE